VDWQPTARTAWYLASEVYMADLEAEQADERRQQLRQAQQQGRSARPLKGRP
jgi:hypothetical protein